MMEPGQVIGFIIGTIVILFGAYFVTYFIGTKAAGQNFKTIRNRNINLHDRFAVNRTASFCIVEIAGKVYVVGVTGNSMTLLDTLNAADFAKLTEKSDANPEPPWGMTAVGKYGNKLTKSLVAFIAAKTGRASPPEPVYSETDESDSDFSGRMKEAAQRTEADSFESDAEASNSEQAGAYTADKSPDMPPEESEDD